MQCTGAHLIHCHTILRAAMAYHLHPARIRCNHYFLYAGCANPVATFAYVNAVVELKQEVDQGILPCPEKIYVPVGSASTLAGLLLGCALMDLPTQIVGVRVVPQYVGPFASCTEEIVQKQMLQALSTLQKFYPSVGRIKLPVPVLNNCFYGGGYGVSSKAGIHARQVFQSQFGIVLEYGKFPFIVADQ